MVLAEAVSAAVAPFGVIYNFTAPGFNHSGKHIRVFSPSNTFAWEHLAVVASNMFNHSERFSGMSVYELVFGLSGYLIAVFVNDVAGVGQIFGFGKLHTAGFPEFFPYAGFKLWKFVP